MKRPGAWSLGNRSSILVRDRNCFSSTLILHRLWNQGNPQQEAHRWILSGTKFNSYCLINVRDFIFAFCLSRTIKVSENLACLKAEGSSPGSAELTLLLQLCPRLMHYSVIPQPLPRTVTEKRPPLWTAKLLDGWHGLYLQRKP